MPPEALTEPRNQIITSNICYISDNINGGLSLNVLGLWITNLIALITIINNWLALVVVVADLVQEQFLDRVELFGPVEEDSGNSDVPAQGEGHRGPQNRGQLE